MVVDVLGAAHLGHDALFHDDDLVGDGHGLGLVVGDVDRRDAQLLLDAADLGAHGHAQLGVQVGQRLVKEQHARLHHQRAGQRHALLLAAGELVGHAALHAAHLHQVQNGPDPLLDFRLGHLAQLEAVRHVVKHIIMREQRVALKHHGGVALVGGQLVDGLAAQVNFALVRALKAGHHAKRRGFSAAGGAQERHEAARRDIQRHVVHGIKVLACLGVGIDLGNVVKANALALLRHLRCPPLSFCWCQNTWSRGS